MAILKKNNIFVSSILHVLRLQTSLSTFTYHEMNILNLILISILTMDGCNYCLYFLHFFHLEKCMLWQMFITRLVALVQLYQYILVEI